MMLLEAFRQHPGELTMDGKLGEMALKWTPPLDTSKPKLNAASEVTTLAAKLQAQDQRIADMEKNQNQILNILTAQFGSKSA